MLFELGLEFCGFFFCFFFLQASQVNADALNRQEGDIKKSRQGMVRTVVMGGHLLTEECDCYHTV